MNLENSIYAHPEPHMKGEKKEIKVKTKINFMKKIVQREREREMSSSLFTDWIKIFRATFIDTCVFVYPFQARYFLQVFHQMLLSFS